MGLDELLSRGGGQIAPPDATDSGFEQLLDELGEVPADFEDAALRIAAFVRGLPGVGVRDAEGVERQLMRRAGLQPTTERRVDAGNAVAVIGLRAYVRALGVWLGVGWRENMKLQAAVSDLAREVHEIGRGQVIVRVKRGALRIQAKVMPLNGGPCPAFSETRLAGVRALANRVDVTQSGDQTTVAAIIEPKVADAA